MFSVHVSHHLVYFLGDVVIVIWDDAFTENFINADDSKDVPPMEEYNKYFSGAYGLNVFICF